MKPTSEWDEDDHYAHAHRYGPEAFLVLPLPSGRIAVVSNYRHEIEGVFDTWEKAKEYAAARAKAHRAESERRDYLTSRSRPSKAPALDIGEIDL